MRWLLVFLLWSVPTAWAAEVCTTIETTGLSREHAALIDEKAYWLAYNVGGQNQYPRRTGNRLCFLDPSFDVLAVITLSAIQQRIQIDEATNVADLIEEEQAERALDEKLKQLGLTHADIQRLRRP